MIVSGQTRTGKTTFLKKFIDDQKLIHSIPFQQIFFGYSIMQPVYNELVNKLDNIELHQGLPQDLALNGKPTLIVMDDLMLDIG